jgi:hypothetical protein
MIPLLIAVGAVIVLAAGFAVGGQTGLFAALALFAVVALLSARLRLPSPPPARPQRPRLPESGFPDYQRISSALSMAGVSRRHFDSTTRPLLRLLLAALLADRHRIDMAKDTGAAQVAVGQDLWPWLDPARPASYDSGEPGASDQTLARIIDRLEDL